MVWAAEPPGECSLFVNSLVLLFPGNCWLSVPLRFGQINRQDCRSKELDSKEKSPASLYFSEALAIFSLPNKKSLTPKLAFLLFLNSILLEIYICVGSHANSAQISKHQTLTIYKVCFRCKFNRNEYIEVHRSTCNFKTTLFVFNLKQQNMDPMCFHTENNLPREK